MPEAERQLGLRVWRFDSCPRHALSLQQLIYKGFLCRFEVGGGPCRDRTYDQLIKSQLLYQLS
jgi:hypothetical protein